MITNAVIEEELKNFSEKYAAQIKTLCAALNTFNASKSFDEYPATVPGCHLIPNDLQMLSDINTFHLDGDKKYIDALKNLPKIQKKKPAIALIIGNGNVISLLDKTNADIILICDIDPRVHTFVNFCKGLTIEKSKQIKISSLTFDRILSEIIAEMNSVAFKLSPDDNEVPNPQFYTYRINQERRLLDGLHFLSNETRFHECAALLQKKHIFHVYIDFFNQEEVDHLIRLMCEASCKITYMNLTNLADYDVKNIMRNALINNKQLPISKKTFNIMATSLDHKPYGSPTPRIPVYFCHLTKLQEFDAWLRLTSDQAMSHRNHYVINNLVLKNFKNTLALYEKEKNMKASKEPEYNSSSASMHYSFQRSISNPENELEISEDDSHAQKLQTPPEEKPYKKITKIVMDYL